MQHADVSLVPLQAALRATDRHAAVGDLFARLVRDGLLEMPFPGEGQTDERFGLLRLAGHHDLSFARLAEGHADALAILEEAGVDAPSGRLGVWAAGPVGSVSAVRTDFGWRLDGSRDWCSGVGDLTHALVRADADDGERLFLVPLEPPGIRPIEGSWTGFGMTASSTLAVGFDRVDLPVGAAIGEPGFYLAREGFWFGAAGVAAVWLGGAEAVAAVAADHAGDDPHRLAQLGWITARLVALDSLLTRVATAIDSRADALPIEQLAQVLRAEVADGAAEILDRTGRITGPGPLCHDREHARRVADLAVYIRQSHAEADLEAIGRSRLRLDCQRARGDES